MRSDPAEKGRAPATTPDDVRAWLVAFFTDLPNAPVYSAGRGQAAFVDPEKSPSGLDWPRFTADVLGPRSRERLWVLTWARCEARHRAIARDLANPPGGGSMREFCREFGIHRATFNRTVARSLAVLAREWDRRRARPEQPCPEGPDPLHTIAPGLRLVLVDGGREPDPEARKSLNFSAPR